MSISSQDIIGKSETEAVQMMKAANVRYRIVAKNGSHYMVTCDYVPSRWNISIHNDVVTNVDFG